MTGVQDARYSICTADRTRRCMASRRKDMEGHGERQADQGSYGQFCPVAMAAEIVCSRWTALVLRELLCGTTRFNDLRRGVPLMSPTLLSKRLKELEEAGVIATVPTGQAGVVEYRLTEAGEELRAGHHVARLLGPALGRDPRCRSRTSTRRC